MTSAHLRLHERERDFAARAGALLGLALRDRPAEVGVAHVDLQEPLGAHPLLRVELVLAITPEQALRLRYGDDVVVTRTDRGWSVELPDTPDDRQASGPE